MQLNTTSYLVRTFLVFFAFKIKFKNNKFWDSLFFYNQLFLNKKHFVFHRFIAGVTELTTTEITPELVYITVLLKGISALIEAKTIVDDVALKGNFTRTIKTLNGNTNKQLKTLKENLDEEFEELSVKISQEASL